VARFYSNENIALPVVVELRRLGHDVVTSVDAGNANAAVPDSEVLAFAVRESRILLSHNRRHFFRLHQSRTEPHSGIVICTVNSDFCQLAQRIHVAVRAISDMKNQLIRVNRPA
jgi:hypothetical protein